MPRKAKKPNMMSGAKWAASHQASVDAVLNPEGLPRVPVTSMGTQFYNSALWTGRKLADRVFEWIRINLRYNGDFGSLLTKQQADSFCYHANYGYVDEKIVIAATPEELDRGTALALVGGAYHEALHTVFSCKRPISGAEIYQPLVTCLGLLDDPTMWAKLTGAILMWSNIIEDIRIERCGIRKYPGMRRKLEELQDFVLKMELQGRAANAHRETGKNDELSVICGTFRDIGLGYKTPLQQKIIKDYEKRAPEAFKFVTEGPLAPMLEKAIHMGPEDDLGCIWLAFEVVAEIIKANKNAQQEPEKEKDEGAMTNPPENNKPPREVDQADAYGDDDGGGETEEVISKKPPIFKVGDRARVKEGAYFGRIMEVTYAGLPDPETGVQELEMRLVEEE